MALFNVAIQARDILAVNKPASPEENESNEDAAKIDEEKASNEEDDMGLAWQMLELARKAYEKNNNEDKYLINLIGTNLNNLKIV